MINSTAHPRWPPSWIGFGFRRLDDKRLGRFVQFFCGLLGVTRGSFLSMISSASMAASAAIFDLVSVDYVKNVCVD
jgi:hypothetical protein